MLLAHAAPELQEQVIGGPLAKYISLTCTNARELRRVLADPHGRYITAVHTGHGARAREMALADIARRGGTLMSRP